MAAASRHKRRQTVAFLSKRQFTTPAHIFIPSPTRRSRARWLREQDATFNTSKRRLSLAQAKVFPQLSQPSTDAEQSQINQNLSISHTWAIYFDNRQKDEYDRLEGDFYTGGTFIAFDGGWNDVLAFTISVRNNISAERKLVLINEDAVYDLPLGSTEKSLDEAIQNSLYKEW